MSSSSSKALGVTTAAIAAMVLARAGAAAAGPFWPGAGMRPYTPADCSQLTPASDPIPLWSRLQWSVGVGTSALRTQGRWETSGVLSSHVGIGLWVKEWACKPSTGGLDSSTRRWQRWSVAATADLLWRTRDADAMDLRPALRLSRARLDGGLLGGSTWVPTTELWLSAGPSFGSSGTGASLGFGGRVSSLVVELRGAAYADARELLVLFGLTDLHGIRRLGPDRT